MELKTEHGTSWRTLVGAAPVTRLGRLRAAGPVPYAQAVCRDQDEVAPARLSQATPSFNLTSYHSIAD
jgi:hypothetical protein